MEWWEFPKPQTAGKSVFATDRPTIKTDPVTVAEKIDPVVLDLSEGFSATPPPRTAGDATVADKIDPVEMHGSATQRWLRKADIKPSRSTVAKTDKPVLESPPNVSSQPHIQALGTLMQSFGAPPDLAAAFPVAARAVDPAMPIAPTQRPKAEAALPTPAYTKPKNTGQETLSKKPPTPKPTVADKPTIRATTTNMKTAMPGVKSAATSGSDGMRAVVSIPDKKVVVYNKDGKVVKEYSVYIGKSKTPTPRGKFKIMDNIKPSKDEWYLGPAWMTFHENQGAAYGFHGWVYDRYDDEAERTDPGWKTSTQGCVQMLNQDVQEFSKLMGVGNEVTILDTPIAPPVPKPKWPEMKQVNPLKSLLGGD